MCSKLITAYIAVRSMSNISDIAVEIAKDEGVDKKDILKLFTSAILCENDTFLTDMLGISVDDMLDKTRVGD